VGIPHAQREAQSRQAVEKPRPSTRPHEIRYDLTIHVPGIAAEFVVGTGFAGQLAASHRMANSFPEKRVHQPCGVPGK
jgi:hypothetical protein